MAKLIAIEGVDGTGKTTQLSLLVKYIRERLKEPVLELDFPRYDKPSAKYVARYLNGEYGSDVAPDLASFLYAFDRWQAKPEVDEFIAKNPPPNGFIISNRYTGSSLAHQGGKIPDAEKRRQFYNEVMDLEFNQFSIPRPDISFVLMLPDTAAQANIDKKTARTYTDKKRDLHEADINHLRNATAAYRELIELYPDKFVAVDCWDADKNQMKTVEEIHKIISELVDKML